MATASVQDVGVNSSTACEFFVVRHGLTDYNKIRRLQGQLDIPLNDEGKKQCEECGAKIRNMLSGPPQSYFTAIYASPLSRASVSAQIICEHAGIYPVCVEHDERLMEWNAGIFQGLLLPEIEKKYPLEWKKWRRHRDPNLQVYGGESLKNRFDRVYDFFVEKAKQHVGHRVLIVTHGGVLDDLLRIVRNIPLRDATRLSHANAEIHIVRARGEEASTPSTEDSNMAGEEACGKNPVWEVIRWPKLKDHFALEIKKEQLNEIDYV